MMKIGAYETHPAADVFPLLSPEEMSALAASIKANGLRQQIVLFEGKILDGRNRALACEIEGVALRTVDVHDVDPWTYSWDANVVRRHLPDGQRAALRLVSSERQAADKAAKDAAHESANEARSKAQVGKPKERRATQVAPRSPPKRDNEAKESRKTSALLAASAHVSSRTMERVAELQRKAPEAFAEVAAGTKELTTAIKEIKRAEVVASLENVAAREVKALAGVYDVLVIDPPWPMVKIERDVRPNQVGLDYPTMTEAQMAALKLPAADNCHVWVWTTHHFLPMAFRLIDGWGLKYVCAFVWHKPGGFQPVGLPQFNCEFALYCRKGSPSFIDTKALPVCFEAPRGAHSEKPDAFYDVVRRVTAGRRADMFNRREIAGFDRWGNEATR